MAETKLNIQVTAKDQASRVLQGLRGSLSSLGSLAGISSLSIAGIGAAIGKLALDASRVNELREAFVRLASEQGASANQILSNIERVARGTVTEAEKIKAANRALLAAIPAQAIDEIFALARQAAKATGDSVSSVFDQIVSGIATGRVAGLKTLGIIDERVVDFLDKFGSQLSDIEKKQFLINALQIEGAKATSNLISENQSLADSWQAVGAQARNALQDIGQVFLPIVSSGIKALQFSIDAINLSPKVFKQSEEAQAFAKSLEEQKIRAQDAAISIGALKNEVSDINISYEELKNKSTDALQQLIDKTKEFGMVVQDNGLQAFVSLDSLKFATEDLRDKMITSFSAIGSSLSGFSILAQSASSKAQKVAKIASIGEVIAFTAAGIARQFKDLPFFIALGTSAAIAATGALQLAKIAGIKELGFAEGGITPGIPTPAIVGERGKEAIIPLENPRALRLISEAIGARSEEPLIASIQIDGVEFGRAITMAKRRGFTS